MLGDDLRTELRLLIREECDAAIREHVSQAVVAMINSGFEPLSESLVRLLNQIPRINELEKSIGLIVAGQIKIEEALQSFRVDDADEPWRQSLVDDDVALDDSDD